MSMLTRSHPFSAGALIVTALSALGCGTLIHGTTQTVSLAIAPPDAQVSIHRWSGERIAGPTRPGELLVIPRPKDREPYLIVAAAPGHCPRYWLTDVETTSAGAWSKFVPLYGNPVGGSFFEAVDRSTGGCCELAPSKLTAVLPKDQACRE